MNDLEITKEYFNKKLLPYEQIDDKFIKCHVIHLSDTITNIPSVIEVCENDIFIKCGKTLNAKSLKNVQIIVMEEGGVLNAPNLTQPKHFSYTGKFIKENVNIPTGIVINITDENNNNYEYVTE